MGDRILEKAALVVGTIYFTADRAGLQKVGNAGYKLTVHNGELPDQKMYIDSPKEADAIGRAMACLIAFAFEKDEAWIKKMHPRMWEMKSDGVYEFFIPAAELTAVKRVLAEIQTLANAMLDVLPGDPDYASKGRFSTLAFPHVNSAKAFGHLMRVISGHHDIPLEEGDMQIGTKKHNEVIVVEMTERKLADILVADGVMEKPQKHMSESKREAVIIESLQLLKELMEKEKAHGLKPERN